MGKYTKFVQSGRFVEVYEYEHKPARNIAIWRKPKGMRFSRSERNRRPDNVRRLTAKFKRLVWANLDETKGYPCFLTLTFRNEVDIDEGYNLLGKFRRKFQAIFPEVEYIAVPEFGTKSTKRLHFHILIWNLPIFYIKSERESRYISSLWGNGFVDILETDGSIKLAGYMAKYLSKALFDERLLNKKAYTTSRGIKRPVETASPLVKSYSEEMWELSTATPLRCAKYLTQWLGECSYTLYKI